LRYSCAFGALSPLDIKRFAIRTFFFEVKMRRNFGFQEYQLFPPVASGIYQLLDRMM
jgi:hypothetical protein